MPSGQTPAPGWYTDTSGARLQWWDGSRWTGQFAPPDHPQRKGVDPENDGLVAFGFITAILLPIIGAMCAVALMARGDRRGGSVLVLSAIMFVAAVMLLAAVSASADPGLERFRPIAEQTFPQTLDNCPGGIAIQAGGLSDPEHDGGEAAIGDEASAQAESRLDNVQARIERLRRKAQHAERAKVRRRVRAKIEDLKASRERLQGVVNQKSCAVHIREDWPEWSPAFACKLVVHEYGHLAGLQHNNNPSDVMNPLSGPESVPACARL